MKYHYLLFGPVCRKFKLRQYRRMARQANVFEASLEPLADAQLTQRIKELHIQAQARRNIAPLIPEALALGREISRRRLGMRHYDVQLIGTLALYDGHIAEMNTGEGKTLMAPLAAFLHRLGRLNSCTHIVTANEYLAARDARWMAPLYEGLGLSVGLIIPGQTPADRMRQYQNDVVYATAKEIVFDSLRKKASKKQTSPADAILRPQPELHFEPTYDFAIVDEVDSVLIDQAQSPMSLGDESAVSPQLALYRRADEVAGRLVRGKHFRLVQDDKKMELKDEGKAEARHQASGVLRLLPSGHRWERYVVCALAARYLYKKDQHYVIHGGHVVLIDESTGRMLPGRQLPEGLHQAVEIRNGILPSSELKGSFVTTFQTFFRRYHKMGGMTGTALSAAYEFLGVYNLAVIPIPPNKPSQRQLMPDAVFRTPKRKYQNLIDRIEEIHRTERPMLIATGSIQVSEQVSQMLTRKNLEHDVLNAKNHAREAEIIAQAGQAGRITIITNMAGRGVDIVLGQGVAQKGGIFLLSTDRLHYRRLDDQLTGRVGRQGDPGQCQFFLSLKDDLLRYGKRKKITRLRLKSRNQRQQAIEGADAARLFTKVQRHIAQVSRRQRHKLFLSEKQREKYRKQGLWEEWMDAR
jgi:preprotein translocase subunit SecA